MIIAPRWRKVIRDLWDNKSRTVLVILSIAIGVFAFGGMFIARHMALTGLNVQYNVTNPADLIFNIPYGFDEQLVDWAARQDDVTAAMSMTRHQTKVFVGTRTINAVFHTFDDYNDIHINQITPEVGAYPPATDHTLIERSYLSQLNLTLEDNIEVRFPDGSTYDLRLTGAVHDLSLEAGAVNPDPFFYVDQRTIYRMGLSDAPNVLLVTVDRNDQTPEAIADHILDEFDRLNIYVRSVEINEPPQHWSADIVAGLTTILVVVGLVSLLLSAFLVVNTISGMMAQQKRQIGVMKIVGASRLQIAGVYLVMVALLGVIAFVIAFPTSIAFAAALMNIIGEDTLNFNTPELVVPSSILALELIVAILVPLLSALMPVINGTSMTAAEAVSDYNANTKNNIFDTILARLSGLPRPMLLSIRNTFRRKIRLAMTLITLTLAGAFFLSIMNVRRGLNLDVSNLLTMSNYDMQFQYERPYDRRALLRRIEVVEGVDVVEGWMGAFVYRERDDRSRTESFPLSGMPQDSAFIQPLIVEGRWLDPLTSENRYDLVVTTEFLNQETDLQVGDVITMKLDNNKEDWTIVGVVDIAFPSVYSYYDTVADFRGLPDMVTQTLILVDPDIPLNEWPALADEISDLLEDRDILISQVTLKEDVIKQITSGLNILVVVLLSMASIIGVVGGLGLSGTMSLNVLERTREIGVMRAVGANNTTIRGMFVGEGILIGVMSVLFSIPISAPGTRFFGTLLGEVIFAKPLTYVYAPVGLIVWLIIILVVSTVASIAPAQRAAQISIREAISYE